MKMLFMQYRLPIILICSLLLIAGVWFGGKHIYNGIYEDGYQAGIVYERDKNAEATKLAKNQADTERQELNNRLDALNMQYQELLKNRTLQAKNNEKELIKYKATPDASKKCLDDGFVNLYNNSL